MIVRHVSPQAVAIDNCFLEKDQLVKKAIHVAILTKRGRLPKLIVFITDHLHRVASFEISRAMEVAIT